MRCALVLSLPIEGIGEAPSIGVPGRLIKINKPGRGAASAAAFLLLLLGIQPAVIAKAEIPRAPRGEPGTVDTLAGPGLCWEQPALGDGQTLGSIVLDQTGGVYIDTGFPEFPRVARLDRSRDGGLQLLNTRPPDAFRATLSPRQGDHRFDGPRIASDGGSGIISVEGSSIVHTAPDQTEGFVVAGAFQPSTAAPSAPENGPAREARFGGIVAVATDKGGNVYVAERLGPQNRERIRLINREGRPLNVNIGAAGLLEVPPGHIRTIAGAKQTPARGKERSASADGAAANDIAISGVTAMAWAADRLYIAVQTGKSRTRRTLIRAINLGSAPVKIHGVDVAPGSIRTLAGQEGDPRSRASSGAEGGPAPSPKFSRITGMAATQDGQLLLADRDNHSVQRIDASGLMTRIAGTGRPGFNGNDIPARHARLHSPLDVEVGPQRLIYIADRKNDQVRVIDQQGFIHATSGRDLWKHWACQFGRDLRAGPMAAAKRLGPRALASLPNGEVVFGGESPGLRLLTSSGRIKRLDPAAKRAKEGGTGSSARGQVFRTTGMGPLSMASGPGTGIYVLDQAGSLIHFVNLSKREVAVHGVIVAPGEFAPILGAARSNRQRSTDPESGGSSSLKQPVAIASGRNGTLLVADTVRGVLEVGPTGEISTLIPRAPSARPGAEPPSMASPPLRCCFEPTGVLADGRGNVYIKEGSAGPIYLLNGQRTPILVHGKTILPDSAEVVVGAGSASVGQAGQAPVDPGFVQATGMAVDGRRNLYVADGALNTIKRIDSAGTVATVAGVGDSLFNGDGAKGVLTAIRRPGGLALDTCGNLLIADFGNDRIRRYNVKGLCPNAHDNQQPARSRTPGGFWIAGALLVLISSWLVPSRLKAAMDRRF